MTNLKKIIAELGGLAELRKDYAKIMNEGWMPLTLEVIGTADLPGIEPWPLLAVSHTYEQEGDLMRDPEVIFMVRPAADGSVDTLTPMSYRQDGLGICRECYWKDGEKTMVNAREAADLKSFCRDWDKNLGAQGFVKAAWRTAELRTYETIKPEKED